MLKTLIPTIAAIRIPEYLNVLKDRIQQILKLLNEDVVIKSTQFNVHTPDGRQLTMQHQQSDRIDKQMQINDQVVFSNQLDCQNTLQAIFASPELYFGFIDCVKAFSRAPNHEDRIKKLVQLYQTINAYMFCPSSNLSVYRKCQRLTLEEVVLNQSF